MPAYRKIFKDGVGPARVGLSVTLRDAAAGLSSNNLDSGYTLRELIQALYRDRWPGL